MDAKYLTQEVRAQEAVLLAANYAAAAVENKLQGLFFLLRGKIPLLA
jgi:hypothetical protein